MNTYHNSRIKEQPNVRWKKAEQSKTGKDSGQPYPAKLGENG